MDEIRFGTSVAQKPLVTCLANNIQEYSSLPLLSAYEMDICS